MEWATTWDCWLKQVNVVGHYNNSPNVSMASCVHAPLQLTLLLLLRDGVHFFTHWLWLALWFALTNRMGVKMMLFKFQNMGLRDLAASSLTLLGPRNYHAGEEAQSTLLQDRRPYGRHPKCSERKRASTAKSVMRPFTTPLNYEITTDTWVLPAKTNDRIIQTSNPENCEK